MTQPHAQPIHAQSGLGAAPERAKVGVYVVFTMAGLAFATWAGRIPATRDQLDLTPGMLGLVLLAGSAGSLLGLPIAGRVASRIGAGRTVLAGATLVMCGLVIAGAAIQLTGSVVLTAVCLGVICFGIGLWDVAMNLHGAEVERLLGRTVMPRFHAAFSLGSVVGAGIAVGMARLEVIPLWHFTAAAALMWPAVLWGVRAFLPASSPPAEAGDAEPAGSSYGASEGRRAQRERSAWTEPRVLLIGFVVLVSAFTEGTANDWLAVAFVDGHDLPEWAGVLGLTIFLTFMTIGRVAGTWLLDRFGRVPVLRVTFVMSAVGSLTMIFGTPVMAFVGAAVWGFGASLGFPVGMSAATDEPRRAAARLSVVATIGYLAFLAGPPALGFLGDHLGVLRALSAVSVLVILSLLVLPVMAKPEDETPAEPVAADQSGRP